METGFEVYKDKRRKDSLLYGLLPEVMESLWSPRHLRKEMNEILDEEGRKIIDLTKTRQSVMRHMIETRGNKYRIFLLVLKAFPLVVAVTWKNIKGAWKQKDLFYASKKGDILHSIYIGARILDDVIDGDAPQNMCPEKRLQYIQERLHNIENRKFDSSDPVDSFFQHAFQVADVLNIGIQKPLIEIIGSMSFDASRIQYQERYGALKIHPEKELEEHFFQLDICGTIGGALLLFDEENSEKNLELLNPLGKATRIFYDLQDFQEDLQGGLCNISQEDINKYFITQKDLKEAKNQKYSYQHSAGIQRWMQEQGKKGEALLKEHKENMKNATHLGAMGKSILYPVYYNPSKKFFNTRKNTSGNKS